MRPSRSANMASASGDEMIITTGVIVSTIHCLMLPIDIGPRPSSRSSARADAVLSAAIRVSSP